MEALKDIAKLLLVLAGLVVAGYLAVVFWPMTLLLVVATIVLLVIKYVVNGRFR